MIEFNHIFIIIEGKEMTKEDLLTEFKILKQYNDNRMKLVQFITNRIAIDAEKCKKAYICTLEDWIESREKILKQYYASDMIKELYCLNQEWLEENNKICQLLKKTEKNRKHSLFGSKKKKLKLEKSDLDKAITYKVTLEEISDTIDKILKKMKKRMEALSIEKL